MDMELNQWYLGKVVGEFWEGKVKHSVGETVFMRSIEIKNEKKVVVFNPSSLWEMGSPTSMFCLYEPVSKVENQEEIENFYFTMLVKVKV
jgi:hypothetical protein